MDLLILDRQTITLSASRINTYFFPTSLYEPFTSDGDVGEYVFLQRIVPAG